MLRTLFVLLAVAAIAGAGMVPGEARGTWVEGDESSSVRIPGDPVPGMGGNALFVFAAYSDGSSFAWGGVYWNPLDVQFPSTWSFDAVNASTVEPEGSPYHWNGGLGTALDNLGYTWEWYPTYDNGDGVQNLPDVSTLQEYDVVFVHTFDYWWTANPALSDGSITILSDFIDAGGAVVLVGQDIHYSGVSGTWLDDYFNAGTITDDVVGGDPTLPMQGVSGTFTDGWSGTADQTNFSDSNGFYTDQISGGGCIGDGSIYYASFDDASKCIFSTAEFEACSSAEVEDIASMIMGYIVGGGAFESRTWGDIKTSF